MATHKEVISVGCFGSLAGGNWSVGSDADLIVVVADSSQDFFERAAKYDTTSLPVPADLLVYTRSEWESLRASRFAQQVMWICHREDLV